MLQWLMGFFYLFELYFLCFLDIYPRVGLLDCMIALFLVFKGTSIVATSIYTLTNMLEVSLFSIPSPGFIFCRLFGEGHLTGVRWYCIFIFICISLLISHDEHHFMFFLAVCLWRNVCLGLLPIFLLDFFFFFWHWVE